MVGMKELLVRFRSFSARTLGAPSRLLRPVVRAVFVLSEVPLRLVACAIVVLGTSKIADQEVSFHSWQAPRLWGAAAL